MHTTLASLPTTRRPQVPVPASSGAAFREPAYDCEEQADRMVVTVYLPGIAASGVEIEGRGADLTVVAHKPQVVRVNFAALHLEGAQRDYRLRLRLGSGFDFPAMAAEISHGILTIAVPKRATAVTRRPAARAA
jgi:HSP20 family molecular chaperone IbpA